MDDNSVMNDSLNVNDLMEEQIYKHVEEDSRNKSFVSSCSDDKENISNQLNESAKESIKLLQESLSASLKKEMEMKANMSPKSCVSFVDLQDSSPDSVQHQRDTTMYSQQFARTLSTSIGCFNNCIIDDDDDLVAEAKKFPSSIRSYEISQSKSPTQLCKKNSEFVLPLYLDDFINQVEKEIYTDASQIALKKMTNIKSKVKEVTKLKKSPTKIKQTKSSAAKMTKPFCTENRNIFKKNKKEMHKINISQNKEKYVMLKKCNDDKLKKVVDSPPMVEMNKVRNHLKTFLGPSIEDESTAGIEKIDIDASQLKNESQVIFENNVNSAGMAVKMFDMLEQAKQLTNQSKHCSNNNKDQLVTPTSEIAILNETLEKERYRRKHCEQEIQSLQKKTLEIKQELAVAHSVEAKKDAMIQQLDKMLMQMLENWKSHEKNLVENILQLKSEKETTIVENSRKNDEITSMEKELSTIMNKLIKDQMKMKLIDTKTKASRIQNKAAHIHKSIDSKNNYIKKLEKEQEALKEDVENLKKLLADAHLDIEKQGKIYVKEEMHWNKMINEKNEKHENEIDEYRKKLKLERERVEVLEMENRRQSREADENEDKMRKLQHKIEEIKLQMNEEIKSHESVLEKLKEEMELVTIKRVREELEKAKLESDKKERKIVGNNKKQVLELIESHKKELESQLNSHKDNLNKQQIGFNNATHQIEVSYQKKLEQKTDIIKEQMKARIQSLLQSHYNQTIQAMGDNSLTEDGSPDISRTYSSTRHVMIRVPQKESPPKNKQDISVLQQPFMNSKPRNFDEPNLDSLVNKYTVQNVKLEKTQNPHYTSVDSLINEKTRSILSNLDNKLSELQESSPPVLPITSPTKLQPEKQNLAKSKSISQVNEQQSMKTDEDLLKSLPDFSSMFMKAIQSTEIYTPLSNDKNTSESSVINSNSNSNSMPLSNDGGERKKMLDHYVRRVLSQQPSDSSPISSSNNESTIPISLKSSLKSSTSMSSSNSGIDCKHTSSVNNPLDVCDSIKPKVRFAESAQSSSNIYEFKNTTAHFTINEKSNQTTSAKLLGIYQQSDSPILVNQKSPISNNKRPESLLEYLNTSPPINYNNTAKVISLEHKKSPPKLLRKKWIE